MPTRIDISKEELERLYWKEGMSAREIADKFDCCHKSVVNMMNRYNIDRRSIGCNVRMKPKKLIYNGRISLSVEKSINRGLLELLYVKREMSIKQISNMLGVPAPTIFKHLKMNNIDRRSYSDALRFDFTIPGALDLAYLLGVYYGDGNINYNGTFSVDVIDYDFADNIFRILKKYSDAKIIKLKRRTVSGNTVFRVSVNRKSFCEFLKRINLAGLNKNQMIMFINGFVDSEGHVSLRKYIEISNCDYKIISMVGQFFNRLDISYTVKKYKGRTRKHRLCYVLHICNEQNNIKFYKHFHFSIKRKQDRLDSIVKSYK